MKQLLVILGSTLIFASLALAQKVEDNSFLVEEAYNQEEGVVQFIQLYQKDSRTKSWGYTFINEFPMFSQTHQFSYEIPVAYNEGLEKTQVRDIKINYRAELIRNEQFVATARFSTILPSGNVKFGFGSGKVGLETALLTSVQIHPKWTQHWNFGAGFTPKAKNVLEDEADNSKYFWAVSQVYYATDMLNFMIEATGTTVSTTAGDGIVAWSTENLISPSVRYAIDYKDWQFVPGLAFPIGLGETAGNNQTVVYLSIEGKMF